MKRIYSIARRQHGAIAWEQMLALGVTPDRIATLTRHGSLVRVLSRVYVVAGSPGTREQALMAAQLWAGEASALTGTTGAEVWDVAKRSPVIELVVPPGVRRRSDKVVVHRSVGFDGASAMRRRGLRVADPARTLFDMAMSVDEEVLEATLEEFLRRRLVRLDSVADLVETEGGRGRPGSGTLRRLIEARDPSLAPANQLLEVKTWRLLDRSDLPRPQRNHPVRCGGQQFVVDFAWIEQRVVLETDGYGPHSGLSAFRQDRRRHSALVAAGWRVLLATWDDVTDANRARRLLAQIAATLALAS